MVFYRVYGLRAGKSAMTWQGVLNDVRKTFEAGFENHVVLAVGMLPGFPERNVKVTFELDKGRTVFYGD